MMRGGDRGRNITLQIQNPFSISYNILPMSYIIWDPLVKLKLILYFHVKFSSNYQNVYTYFLVQTQVLHNLDAELRCIAELAFNWWWLRHVD